ncbi:uncharacterized protein LOC123872089 [Maniola jurtina]|uniref:uncharacterized protein LOC123872089 n=1 Tax=Maniola jurtina TaxID=191418 RepID=UPI001E68EBBE|nr:uncharacterized protein LOC123872089 [Maniola jurtina]
MSQNYETSEEDEFMNVTVRPSSKKEHKSFEDADDDSSPKSLARQVKLLGELVTREMSSMRQELSRLNLTISGFDKRVSSIEERLDILEQKILPDNRMELQERLEKLEKRSPAEDNSVAESVIISQLRLELNEREQDNMLNDVEIAGLDEKSGESTINIALLVAKKIGLSLEERDIVSAERLGPRRIIADDAAGQRRPPRAIVVRLARRSVRDDLLRAARVRRGADTSGIIEAVQSKRFYVNERLTAANKHLFYKTRELGRRDGWRYVWTKDGRIYARRKDGSEVCRIRTPNDITKFFGNGTV